MFKINCEKCQEKSCSLDTDLTIMEYYKIYQDSYILLEINEINPPDFIIISCNNPGCRHSSKLSILEYVSYIRDQLSFLAFQSSIEEKRKSFEFENYRTKYLIEKGIGVVSQEDIENNPLIKDYINYVKKFNNRS